MEYGLIGEKLGHSASKEIHEQLANYSYELHPLTKDDFPIFMEEKAFRALNVTIPYKQAVIPYLTAMDENAKAIGAVNTIVNQNGSLYGYNTDMPGFLYMVKKNGIDMEGKKVVVLGNGGASQAIQAGVKKMNPAKMIVVGNRTIKEGVLTYEQCFALHSDADIVVNTSPVGMYPNVNFSPVDLTHFPQCQAVIDIIANPLTTKLVAQARELGMKGITGLEMLIAQAKYAVEIFLDTKIPEEKIDEIIVAMPAADRKQLAEVLNVCKETKCRLKRVPGYYQILNGDVHLSDLKDVEVQDLLGRDQIEVNLSEIMEYVKDKVVMVTGGGGSIGSELCRQIAASNPKQLIIVDIYENNAYDIQLELKDKYPYLNLETLIASVRNTDKVNHLFEQYHPDIVYHAAAHKHVPLMEDSPCEAVKNNVFGTLNVVRAADKCGTKRFILISTDKAVNPTNVMGATKRMCEMIVQSYNKKSNTEYVAVRFGNVLGSNGSVIPLFKKQIKAGGPVTVTHPDIIRYFMTIPEAVSLVLQAGAYAKGGEIFVLDMGEPVKIDDMARNLIKLSGYEPGIDIKIEYTGLRPGEKLFEELLMKEEGMQDTPNKLIHIGKPIELDEEKFFNQLVHLKEVAYQDSTDIRKNIKEIVDTYQPQII